MGPNSGASFMLSAVLLLLVAHASAHQGYGEDYGGGSSSSSASASSSSSSNNGGSASSASAASSSSSGGGRGRNNNNNNFNNNNYGGGGGGGYGHSNCGGGCNSYGGKRLLSMPSIQDFMTSLGFGNFPFMSNNMVASSLGAGHNIVEMPDHFEVFIIIPKSTCKGAFRAEIVEGTLFVSAINRHAEKPNQAQVSVSSFAHSMSVPGNIKATEITTRVADGMLVVKLPKS